MECSALIRSGGMLQHPPLNIKTKGVKTMREAIIKLLDKADDRKLKLVYAFLVALTGESGVHNHG